MWTVYELTLNLYQGFLYTWFITKILSRKNDEWWPFTACALLTALGFSTYLVWPLPFEWDTWVFVFIAAYSIIFLKGTLLRKIFWILMLIIMTSGTIGIIYQVFNLILGADIDFLLQESGTRIIFTISVNFCLWLVLFLITRLFQNQNENDQPSQVFLITGLLCVTLIDVFFRLVNKFDLPLIWLLFGCLIALSFGIATLITYKILVKYTRMEQEYHFQQEMLEGSERQIEEMKEIYGSTLKLRHDMRAFVNDIQEMVHNGEITKAPRYLDEMEQEVLPLYSTGNQALDSVLMVKVAKIQSAGIEFRGTNLHYTGGMNIRDAALCSLVSNMLDNAFEALNDRKEQPGSRYIYLGFNYSLAGLMIICENPLLGIVPKMVKTSFFTNKTEPYHGLGISIMERIVHEANGHLEVTLYEDCFRVLAIIPPKEATGLGSAAGDDYERN